MKDTLEWLLEVENPSARYLALRHLLNRAADDPPLIAARTAIPGWGPARAILDAQWPAGYWVAPGVGYSPRHRATTWQVIFLAALGAPLLPAIARACDYILTHSRLPDGRFTAGNKARGATLCLNGGLLRAMLQLGYHDPRVDGSLHALAEMVRRGRFRCRFNAPHPLPARMDAGRPCPSGAVKALGAFVEVPEARRSPAVRDAAEAAVQFLTGETESGEPVLVVGGDCPTEHGEGARWHRFGFPPDDLADLLEAVDVVGRAGAAPSPNLEGALAIVRARRSAGGAWPLDRTPENTWAGFGPVGRPNKWVTIRALAVLHRWAEET
ncbi:MAG: hypothetical protein JXA93_26155 [Anaerolineae bacterium]|nr:hypothetical protein [Anaerolineae bacterium]